MSKIYQQLEAILKFRIYSNAEIAAYMNKLSLMGKIDDVKRHAILSLILVRLGELEDNVPDMGFKELKYEGKRIEPPSGEAYLMPDIPERRVGTSTDVDVRPDITDKLKTAEADRKEQIKQQRIENMAKARAAKKATKVL